MVEELRNEKSAIAMDFSVSSQEAIELFVEESSDDTVYEEILNANKTRVDVIKLLYDHPNTPDGVRAEAARILSVPVPSQTQIARIRKISDETKARIPEEVKKESLILRIRKLGVSEKIKLAFKGGSEARSILMKDSNKLVSLAVLDNPRLSTSEVVSIARNRSALEEALRIISKNKEWVKFYSVTMALVTNPKTPPGIAIQFVGDISIKDLKLLEKNKGVSDAVRSTAKRVLQAKMKK